MKTKIIKNANYIGWIVIILAFLFIYFSYFFMYIPKKEAQLQQKGFRILKEYGSNMLDKHNYFENHFKNYGTFYSIRFLENKKVITKKNTRNIKRSDEIENVIGGLQTYVNTANEGKKTSYVINDKNNELALSFYFKNTEDLILTLKDFYESKDELSIDSILKKDYYHNVPIDDFMNKLKFDRLFENIILFDSEHVYYNSKSDNLADITNPLNLSDSAKTRQGGIYKVLNIREKNKHAIILPVDFAGKKFYIAGFISDTDFRNKTRTINKQYLIFIAAILMLVFASMPVLKIFFIDERERLKARDATSSAISLFFGISLFILLIISFSKKQIVDNTIQKNRIQMISDSLYSNVKNDIDSIKALGKDIAREEKSQYATLANNVTKVFNSNNMFFQDPNLSCPFPLNEIILTSNSGIFKKGYTRTPFSDIVEVDLHERQYFKNIIDINKSWPTYDGLNFYIESIKSFNTGAVETAISFRTNNFGSLPVLAITSVIPSLYHQVLPKDIEFVIINKKGKVLYHSIEQKSLHENFVLECESNLRLINAISLNIEDKIQVSYNEKEWLARIIPMEETPFYHITLLDLNQADNKNARIFLFTFYFLIASLIFMIVGLLIIRWITRAHDNKQKNTWFLNWLILHPCQYLLYKKLSIILIVIVVFQLLGYYFAANPIALLLYQLIFIVFTLFVSMVFLNREKTEQKKSFWDKFLTEVLILAAALILILLFMWKFSVNWEFLIPLTVLIVILIFIHPFFKSDIIKKMMDKTPKKLSDSKIRVTYLTFLFLWLTSISGAPIVEYYYTIKKHEEIKWQQEQLRKVAIDNIDLQSVYKNTDKAWFKRIQGNGIDFLNVSYTDVGKAFDSPPSNNNEKVSFNNDIYDMLPDPITTWYNQPKLFTQNDYVVSKFENNTLYYKRGLQTGAVTVNYVNPKRLFSNLNYLVLVFFVFMITTLCVWLLLKYLASVLLNLNQEKTVVPGVSWFEILEKAKHKRIRLNTFDGSCFLEKSKEYLASQKGRAKKITTIAASHFIASDFKIESLPSDSASTIWICGLSQIIYEIDMHEKLLSVLIKLNQSSNARIIVDLSFDIDLIDEFYSDYIATSELKPEQLTNIFLLKKKWKTVFENYLIYDGYINQNNTSNSEIIRTEDNFRTDSENVDLELQFKNIWNNLTAYEKILLFDLADDGLLNRKNKTLIQELVNKRLIVTDPFPSFFSEDFRDFVRNSIKSAEVKTIERKLGLKGSWHNAKYLILLVIIPLAALIIISQGISIEKVFGIFAGGLAILTGMMRLFDSNFFKQSS